MKAIFGYQNVAEIVEECYPKYFTTAQKTLNKENKRKDCKTTFLIHYSHQCYEKLW